jgi:helix-turn-helix protein
VPLHDGERATQSIMSEELAGCERSLEHPLRQALFVLLRHRPASAPELQRAVGHPLKAVRYHLGVLVRRECLLAESGGETTTYRVDPRVAHLLPRVPEPGQGRVVMMSLLDAAWAAIGRSPQDFDLEPHWETFQLDGAGLHEASAVVGDAIERIRRIAAVAQGRLGADGDARVHTLVAVASLAEPPPTAPGELAG